MKKTRKKQSVVPEYLTVEMAASYMSISIRTVYSFLNDRLDPIPHFRKGRLIRIRRAELVRWMESYRAVNQFKINDIVEDVLG